MNVTGARVCVLPEPEGTTLHDTAAFDRVDPKLADAAEPILELLAAEVAVAIDRDRMLADLQSLAVADELRGRIKMSPPRRVPDCRARS